ncbi:prepilin-type N-terminal cleavage/methylation domain-containing protein [Cronbergia sp. UHCC 0137]|uniref:pilus assembly FimT family protein n=1 Tax=Cronbergia sp. UHCC 0137 TaxID=3110239 RepID=UPI002B20DB56|nr:prepilin-type N-terminal cleavage/methylation domain-containing protein [Cronbergia sp. UHCC 0137]MEA5617084.1 prepilin-type N-terminal cleavage/methylation domain-containing protein [Cronbergia sp. UHCC 0137]
MNANDQIKQLSIKLLYCYSRNRKNSQQLVIKSTQQDAGFNLIELLITIAMVGILSAVALPSWVEFINARRLNSARSEVQGAIREARDLAKNKKLTWQASFRTVNNVAQWAVHNAKDTSPTWNKLDSNVVLASNLSTANGVSKIQFGFDGDVKGQLGKVTLSSKSGGKTKRCVIVSTLLGAMRTAKDIGCD